MEFAVCALQTLEYSVAISVMEVYNDIVRDQLSDNGAGDRLEVKHGKDGQVAIAGLTSVKVCCCCCRALRSVFVLCLRCYSREYRIQPYHTVL